MMKSKFDVKCRGAGVCGDGFYVRWFVSLDFASHLSQSLVICGESLNEKTLICTPPFKSCPDASASVDRRMVFGSHLITRVDQTNTYRVDTPIRIQLQNVLLTLSLHSSPLLPYCRHHL